MSRTNVLCVVFSGVLVACGDGGPPTQTGDGESSAADASTSGGGATTTTTAATDDPTSGAASTSTSDADDADTSTTAPPPDLPPYPTACDAPEAFIDVAEATTPDGPMSVDEAWIASDACGSGPYIVLAQTPTIDDPHPIELQIELAPRSYDERLVGEIPASVWTAQEATGTVTLLEPYTRPEMIGTPRPDVHMHAQIEVHTGGYALSLEVDLVDCGVGECYCPCR